MHLSDRALHIDGLRIPRDRITGIEFDRKAGPGAVLFLSGRDVLARVEFDAADRPALEEIKRALAPRRRKLRLLLEGEDFAPGETLGGRVELDWPKAAPVRGIRVEFTGEETTEIQRRRGSGDDERTVTYSECETVCADGRVLFGRRPISWVRAVGEGLSRLLRKADWPVLPAGRHSFPFEFRLPAGAPPSYEGRRAKIRYRLLAQVDIPLGFDLTSEGEIPVVGPREARLVCAPRRERREGGLLSAEVTLDLALEECRLRPEETLRGRLRVENHSKKKLRGATVSLRRVEDARAEGEAEETAEELASGYLKAPDPSASEQEVGFAIRLPEVAPYRGRHSSVRLVFGAELDVAMGFDTKLEVPLRVTSSDT